MGKKYRELFELIEADGQAKQYFEKLPDYVQETICQRAGRVNSFESLQDYAQNLTRGDN